MKALDRIITSAKRMALPAVAVLGSYLGNPAYSQETKTEETKPLVAYVQQDKTNNSREEVKEEKLEGESNIGKPLPTTPWIGFYRGYRDLNKDGKPQWNELVGVSDYADKDDKNARIYLFVPKSYLEKGAEVSLIEETTIGKLRKSFEKSTGQKLEAKDNEKNEIVYYNKISFGEDIQEVPFCSDPEGYFGYGKFLTPYSLCGVVEGAEPNRKLYITINGNKIIYSKNILLKE